jgi:hypothetical protein
VGVVVAGQARLPELARPAQARRPAACWAVGVASGPASAASLRRGLVRLRRAGLQATLRPGRSPQSQVLVVPVASRSGARAARAKAVRLGYPGSTVLRLPATACWRWPAPSQPASDRVGQHRVDEFDQRWWDGKERRPGPMHHHLDPAAPATAHDLADASRVLASPQQDGLPERERPSRPIGHPDGGAEQVAGHLQGTPEAPGRARSGIGPQFHACL